MLPQHARDESRCALIQELRRGKPISLSTQTCSMRPSILPGDSMTVRSVDSNDLLCGDILLIESEDEWIIHRLLALRPLNEEIYAITRGDNADNLDQPVPIKRILGKVTEIRRDNRDVPIPPVPAYNNVHEAVLLASFPSMVYPFSLSRNSSTDGHAEGVASSALAPHVAASRPYHRQTRGLVGSSRRLDHACSAFCGRL